MKLVLTRGWQGEEENVSETPSQQFIIELMNSLDWQDFNSIKLEKNSKNWMDVSGNTNSDGLCIVVSENNVIHVSNDAPKGLDVLISALTSYLLGDEQFKSIGFSSLKELDKKNSEYTDWKVRYDAKQVIEKRTYRVSIFIGLITTGLIFLFLYLWVTDEFRYIGRNTDHAKAEIIEFSLRPAFRSLNKFAKYKFTYQNKKYYGYFNASRTQAIEKKGDRLKVKFVIDDPSTSKRIASYKNQY